MGRYQTNLIEPERHDSSFWKWLLVALIVLIVIWIAAFGSKAFANRFPKPEAGKEILRSLDRMVDKVTKGDSTATDSEAYLAPPPDQRTESAPAPAAPKPAPPMSNDPGVTGEVNGYVMTGVTIERNAPPTVYLKKGATTRSFVAGDHLDDYTIVEIHRFYVILERNSQRTRLEFNE
jgi:hypothetical protein